MWIDVGVVELFHCAGVHELVGVPEALDEKVQLSDDVGDGLVEFEIFLNEEAEQFCLRWLFEGLIAHYKLYPFRVSRIECCKAGFLGVRDEVIIVEVFDEIIEFRLGKLVEFLCSGGRDYQGSIIGIGVDF